MSAPAQTTADRADKLSVGRWVHLEPFTLTDPTPDDGWVHIKTVGSDGAMVSFTDDADVPYALPVDRLVRIGWP